MNKTKNNLDAIQKAIHSLEQNCFAKIIAGASNTDSEQVKKIAKIYSLAGADAIDVAPSQKAIDAANNGIQEAFDIHNQNPELYPSFNKPIIMTSINTQDKIHFSKVELDTSRCTNCQECLDLCPSGALFAKNGLILYNKERCYGCGRCTKKCKSSALEIEQIKFDNPLNLNGMDSVEIHIGDSNINELAIFLNNNKNLLRNIPMLSFSIESKKLNYFQIIEYINFLKKLYKQKIIIQIDGISMGASNSNSSSLLTLAMGGVLSEAKLDVYIQLAGGTNHLTKKLVKDFNLNVSGIGYGTFAKKIILPYLREEDKLKLENQLQRFVNIATSLVEKQ